MSTIDGLKRCIDALETHARELEQRQVQIFERGYDLGSSNNISLPDALHVEFGETE